MTTPDPKILSHPEYRRVYDHYVQQGQTPETAARLAYEHTVWHLAKPPAPTKHPVLTVLAVLGLACVLVYVLLVLPIQAAFN